MNSFKDSILRVMRGDSVVGAAFLVSERLVVTCAHVVKSAGVEVGGKISLCSSDGREIVASVESEFWRDTKAEDISILRLKNPVENLQPVILGSSSGTEGHNFSTFGFPKRGQELSGSGEIIGQATINGLRLLQIDSKQVTPGFSGAPIFDDVTNRVVGMVVAITPPDEYQRLGTTAFAIPSETIRETCPELQISDICPYRSLDVFNEEDSPFFFGRERVVQKMLDSLKREPRFLAVLGPSGSGKSSVVRAGLIPALKQGKVPECAKCRVFTIRPANQPFEQLDNAGLSKSQEGLEKAVRTWLESHLEEMRLVLVIDQFEELLVSTQEDSRRQFIKQLASILSSTVAITIIITLRDDFYSRFLQDAPVLTSWLERGLVNIPITLDVDELRAMMVEPAEAVGLNFEDGLLDAIIKDAIETDRTKEKARSTILPLLEFALTQLWEKRQEGRLTHNAYYENGGVTGGLVQWADRAYYALNPNEQRLAKDICCKLVHLGNEKEQIPDTRRVQLISKLEIRGKRIGIERIVSKLVQARLLSTMRDLKTGKEQIEIIHEALLREWGLLKRWIEDFKNREQIANERRRRWITTGFAFGFLITFWLSVFAFNQRNSAINSQNTAVAEEYSRATAQYLAINSQNTAVVEASIRATAQAQANSKKLLALANSKMTSNFNQALLLGVEAFKDGSINKSPDPASRELMMLLLQSHPGLVRFLQGHNNSISTVIYSPNGQFVASSGYDNKIILWSITNGSFRNQKEIKTADTITAINFSPNSTLLVIGTADGKVSFWDLSNLEAPKNIAILNVHASAISDLTFSSDGRFFASSGLDSQIDLWDISDPSSPKKKSVFHGQEEGVGYVSISPDGKILVAGGYLFNPADAHKDIVILYDISNLNNPLIAGTIPLPEKFSGGGVFLNSLSTSADGRILSFSTGGETYLWNISNPAQPLKIAELAGALSKISPNHIYLVTADNNILTVWDTSDLPQISKVSDLAGHTGQVTCIAFSPDSKSIISGSNDHSLIVWDNVSYYIPLKAGSITNGGTISDLSISPSGKLLSYGNIGETIPIWDISNPANPIHIIDLKGHKGQVQQVSFSPDGKTLASLDDMNSVILWNISRLEAPKILQTITAISGKPMTTMSFNSTGTILAIGSDDGNVTLWDISSLTGPVEKTSLAGYEGRILSEAFSLDGKSFALATGNKVIVWDLVGNSYQKKSTLEENGDLVFTVAYGLTSNILVSGGRDNSIHIWVRPVEGAFNDSIILSKHFGFVNKLVFNSASNLLFSGGEDGNIFVWDFTNPSMPFISGNIFANHLAVRSMQISHDDKLLVTGHISGNIMLWDIDTQSWLSKACAMAGRNFTDDEWQQYFPGETYRISCSQWPAGQ